MKRRRTIFKVVAVVAAMAAIYYLIGAIRSLPPPPSEETGYRIGYVVGAFMPFALSLLVTIFAMRWMRRS